MTPFTSEINPQGYSTQQKLDALVVQLQNQNRELREIIGELQREVTNLKKGTKS
jgi:cell division protein FtsB